MRLLPPFYCDNNSGCSTAVFFNCRPLKLFALCNFLSSVWWIPPSERLTFFLVIFFVLIRTECNYLSLHAHREDEHWSQCVHCQRWQQCIQVPHLTRQWLLLQRLFFTLSEDGLLYHTVFIILLLIIISGCRSFLRLPPLLLFFITIHKHILQRQDSKEQDGWVGLKSRLLFFLANFRLSDLEGANNPACSHWNKALVMWIWWE